MAITSGAPVAFPTAIIEVKRWVDTLSEIHEQDVAAIRRDASALRERTQKQEQEISRLRAEIDSLRAKASRASSSTKPTPPPAPPPGQQPPAPPPAPSPPVAPPAASKARERGAETAAKENHTADQVVGDYEGVVKQFFSDKGFGFIACDALKEYAGEFHQNHSDIFFHSKKLEFDVRVGDFVRFEAYIHKDRLQARNLMDASLLNEEVGPADGDSLGEHVGVLKAWDSERRTGWIACADLKDSMPAGQRDVFLHKTAVGDFPAQIGIEVTFDAFFRKGQLQARHLQDATADPLIDGIHAPMQAEGEASDALGRFTGVIKAFNYDKGFGFIACDELKDYATGAQKHTDVFVSSRRNTDYEFNVGAEVSFEAYMDKGRMQARYLQDPSQTSATALYADDAGAAESKPGEALGDYVGVIKTYYPEKNYGFIVSDDIEGDIYVHSRAAGDFPLQAGNEVLFEAYVHKGRVQARNLRAPTAGDQDGEILGEYVGTVKVPKNNTKGFIFVACPDFDTDVFVHPKCLANVQVNGGDEVRFEAFMHKGRVQGRYLQPITAGNVGVPPPPPPPSANPAKKRKMIG